MRRVLERFLNAFLRVATLGVNILLLRTGSLRELEHTHIVKDRPLVVLKRQLNTKKDDLIELNPVYVYGGRELKSRVVFEPE